MLQMFNRGSRRIPKLVNSLIGELIRTKMSLDLTSKLAKKTVNENVSISSNLDKISIICSELLKNVNIVNIQLEDVVNKDIKTDTICSELLKNINIVNIQLEDIAKDVDILKKYNIMDEMKKLNDRIVELEKEKIN